MKNVACTHCSKLVSISDILVGKSIRCLSCGSLFLARTFSEIKNEEAARLAKELEKESELEALALAEAEKLEQEAAEHRRIEWMRFIYESLLALPNKHYVELEETLRAGIEVMTSELMTRELVTWCKMEAAIYGLVEEIPGRIAYFAQKREQAILCELAVIAKNSAKQTQILAKLLESTEQAASAERFHAKTLLNALKGVKQGTDLTAVLSANTLGHKMSDEVFGA